MKWFVAGNKFTKYKGYFMFIPCISIWYDKYHFLETGIYTPSFGLKIGWFNLTYNFVIQKGY